MTRPPLPFQWGRYGGALACGGGGLVAGALAWFDPELGVADAVVVGGFFVLIGCWWVVALRVRRVDGGLVVANGLRARRFRRQDIEYVKVRELWWEDRTLVWERVPRAWFGIALQLPDRSVVVHALGTWRRRTANRRARAFAAATGLPWRGRELSKHRNLDERHSLPWMRFTLVLLLGLPLAAILIAVVMRVA